MQTSLYSTAPHDLPQSLDKVNIMRQCGCKPLILNIFVIVIFYAFLRVYDGNESLEYTYLRVTGRYVE